MRRRVEDAAGAAGCKASTVRLAESLPSCLALSKPSTWYRAKAGGILKQSQGRACNNGQRGKGTSRQCSRGLDARNGGRGKYERFYLL